ncbi:MAG: OpgC domain-containing protein [Pseudomonadota bacterium]
MTTKGEAGVSAAAAERVAAMRGLALAALVALGALGLARAAPAPGEAASLLGSLDAGLRAAAIGVFLFASGWATAPFWNAVFQSEGTARGALRVAHRVWQIYWRYIGAVAASAAILTVIAGPEDRAAAHAAFGLGGLAEAPRETMLGLALLIEQPAAFAPLQAYALIVLAAPLMIVIGARAPAAALGISAALYLVAQGLAMQGVALQGFDAPRGWPLDPVAWQLAFCVGFAFGAGWIRPEVERPRAVWLIAAAGAAVSVASIALSGLTADPAGPGAVAAARPWLLVVAAAIGLAAYGGLRDAPAALSRLLARIGRQSLAALAALGPILALLQGLFGPAPSPGAAALSALCGLCLLYAAAAISAWFMDPPWAKPAPRSEKPRAA